MAVLTQLSERELFLLTVESDDEESPWMVMADLQVRDIDLLKPILLLHAQQQQLPWYIASYLMIAMPRPEGERTLEAAPDLLVATAPDRLRTSWSVVDEGKAPEFVLEVASGKSWPRDSADKPLIYEGMGVWEYALFAPERTDGPKLFGWRRDAAGAFVEWPVDERGVLWSRALGGLGLYVERGLWLRAVDAAGRRLPTPAELASDERHRADGEAARAEAAERQAAEEGARARAAEEEVERLREELRRLRREQA
jgi:Uma2 family endonuclease